MNYGLQVRMPSDELKAMLSERIRERQAKADALDERIKRRKGDRSYDIRADDGLETLGELVEERDRHHQRIAELTLFHERLAVDGVVVMTMDDLRAADLLQLPSRRRRRAQPAGTSSQSSKPPIDGLKLTMSGYELLSLLGDRIEHHETTAEWWIRQAARTPEEQTDDEPLLPEHLCRNEADRHTWRARVLRFIRAHVEATDMFRLGPDDLAFGELLPPAPGSVEQDEFEDRRRIGVSLERIAKYLPRVMP